MPEINLLQNQLKDTTMVSSKRTMIAVWIMAFLLFAMAAAGLWMYLQAKTINTVTAGIVNDNNKFRSEIAQAEDGLP